MKVFKNFGFTMVELMIVVIIIGILASIGIPNYMRSVERAKGAQGLAILKTMRTAQLDYFRENDAFTGDILELADQIGVSFDDTRDWSLTTTGSGVAAAATTFTITMERLGGPHAGDILVIDQNGDLSASGYPYDDPGTF